MLRKAKRKEAAAILRRKHYLKVVHQASSLLVGQAREFQVKLKEQFPEATTHLSENKAKKVKDFLVLDSNNRVSSSQAMADWNTIPASAPHYVFVEREYYDRATSWSNQNLEKILADLTKSRIKREQEAKKHLRNKRAAKGAS